MLGKSGGDTYFQELAKNHKNIFIEIKKNEIVCVCVCIYSIFFRSNTISYDYKHYFSGYIHILGCLTVELMSTSLNHQKYR